MEKPVAVVKAAISPGSIIKLALGSLALFAILDFAGVTNWILFPVSTAKAKFAARTTTPA